jgi:hypothetical protein
LRHAEVQYVAKGRIGRGAVDPLTALLPTNGFGGPSRNVAANENDLKFRERRLFCNIEPKIRQYG